MVEPDQLSAALTNQRHHKKHGIGGKSVKYVLAALLSSIPVLAWSQTVNKDSLRIGLAAPLSGSYAPLGLQLAEGGRVAANAQGLELTISDDQCNAAGGEKAAEQFVAVNVQIVTGFLCSEALEAALPILDKANIPVIASAISDMTLTERRTPLRSPVFRLSTGIDKETQATATFLASLWRSQPFAIIDDGTIDGRERAEKILASVKEQQLKPVFTDTYRPGLENQNALVSRLRRAGATHVYVGGERDDIAAIGASATALKYPLVMAGGSVLEAAPSDKPLPIGTLMVAPIMPQDLPTAKPALNALSDNETLIEAYSVLGYASVDLAEHGLKEARKLKQPISNVLRDTTFETMLGTLKFDANGLRTDNPNRLQSYDGTRFIPADR